MSNSVPTKLSLNLARINSKEVKQNDFFFAIKGKKNDGNKFVSHAFKNKASIAIVNRIQKKFQVDRQIKVSNTLKFLTNVSKIFRTNINTNIIAIELSLKKFSISSG